MVKYIVIPTVQISACDLMFRYGVHRKQCLIYNKRKNAQGVRFGDRLIVLKYLENGNYKERLKELEKDEKRTDNLKVDLEENSDG